jgi:hypothetical protein
MERTQLFNLMGELKLYGMKAAFDEIMATAVKRQHEPQRIVGDLLNAEISEKQDRPVVRARFHGAERCRRAAVGHGALECHPAILDDYFDVLRRDRQLAFDRRHRIPRDFGVSSYRSAVGGSPAPPSMSR